MKPLAIDLYCGLGGWTEGLLSEGYEVVGFDVERHEYGDHKYPAQLVIQDVLTLHGSQFKDAALIVASPPCQAYSYRAMPWKRAKELPPPDNTLFEACFRIQCEASEAAGRHIPLVVENVRGAQPWVGRAAWHYGSFYLWGDIPALMPIVVKRNRENGAKTPAGNCSEVMWKDRPIARLAHATPIELERHGFKNPGFRFDGSGKSFQSESVNRFSDGVKLPMPAGGDSLKVGFQQTAHKRISEQWRSKAGQTNEAMGLKLGPSPGKRWEDRPPNVAAHREGTKQRGLSGIRNNGKGDGRFQDGAARHGSKSSARKAASAMIAKIPFVLAQHIARAWKPES